MTTLDEQLKRGSYRAAKELDEQGYFGSAMRFSSPFFTSPRLATLFDELTQAFGGAYVLEKNFADLVDGTDDRRIVAYETAKSLTERLQPLCTASLNGKQVSLTGDSVADLIRQYVADYRGLTGHKVITSEQLVINHAAEHFHGLAHGLENRVPSYRMREDVFREKKQPVRLARKAVKGKHETYSSAIDFSDVIGREKQKLLIRRYLINPFTRPEDWARLKARPEKIIDQFCFLFYGPTGTGKTHMAEAIAGEIDIPFYPAKGPDFVQSLLGEGKNVLAQLYAKAASQPRAIVYIDEADELLTPRGSRSSELKGDVITEFLSTLDGLQSTGTIATIMSSNKLLSTYDTAVLDRIPIMNRIYFGSLNHETTTAILEYRFGLFRQEPMDEGYTGHITDRIKELHPRFIKQFTQAAALNALDYHHEKVTHEDIEEAIEDTIKRMNDGHDME